MLDGLRVLDLTDERGLLCGRLLADLGADVVQVEPASGSSARAASPIDPNTGISFTWHSFAAGKRSIALDPGRERDRDQLRDLVGRADVVVTSWDHDELDRWSMTPREVRALAPACVMAAITAFGWDGPRARLAASDLTVWAAGGPLAPHRDGDRPPLRISVPQAYLHAAADAATGILLALIERDRSGEGQFVDVSAQVSVGQATLARILAHAVGDDNPEWQQQPTARADQSGSGAATPNSLKKWHCRDGMIELHLSMGAAAGAFTNRLFGWLFDEGAVDERIARWDWREVPRLVAEDELDLSDLEEARAAVRTFLATKTKAEVVEQALQRRLLSMAIFDVSDVATSPHLAERGFFGALDIEGTMVQVPAVFAQVTDGPSPALRGRAPKLDEHHDEVLAAWRATPRDMPARSTRTRTAPLEGVKVLDLSWVVAGPLIGRSLADFGATVVRVESSTRVETARMMQPFHDGSPDREGSALFGNCNAGKLGVTLDLASPEGRDIVRDLVRWADVVIESFSPGQLSRWGLDYASLRDIDPSIVMLSSSIAGQRGRWAKLAGFGNVGSSLSGFQHLVGWPDRLPMGPFGPYTDYLGPRTALVALLSALRRRERTGAGCYIDVSQVEAGAYFLSPQLAHYGFDGTIAERCGNADPDHAPHGVYPVKADEHGDRFIAIGVRDDEQWERFARLLDVETPAGEDYSTRDGRQRDAESLDKAIATWTCGQDGDELATLLSEMGIPVHLALRPEDYPGDPQIRHRRHLVELAHPLHGMTIVEGARVLLTDTPGGPRTCAPTLGQHNRRVLSEFLDYDTETIDELETKGVLR
ncbi:hypothetical protein BHE97_08800 [Aeromicrobium sp. PE09-221]|uniref:CaiB/BaiF CoA-transferase family protein n=1 Tax=Aeromicrobium sp. PE09-221 TaxID=1898043 RepID=UPI000B739E41|nr:CoA transferase [Aeromicrobium sp. PE09-221]OUZ10144.1 hypothetical protein BHE97_08800 [Aeromicrobium sp. PE09-221]